MRDIEVLVRDEHNQPVPGASLVLSSEGKEWLSESELPANVVALTDVEGKAVVKDVPRSGCLVAAVKVPVGASAFRAVSHRGTVELALAACDTEMRGRVVDHLGRGVAGVNLVLEQDLGIKCWFSLHRPVPEPLAISRHAVSATDGGFVFRASRSWGTCFVLPRLGRLRTEPHLVTVGEGSDLQFEVPGRAVLRGVVLDWAGEPVSGCDVWAGEPVLQFRFDDSTGSVVTADPAGRFEIPLSKAGSYVIVPLGTATSPAGRATTIEVTENVAASIELRTAEPASIGATVVGTRNRLTRIVAQPEPDDGTRTREIMTSGDGEFAFHGLMRGVQYDLVAYQGDDVVARARQEAGDAGRVVLRSTRLGTCALSCRVLGDGIQGIAQDQARITVHPIDERFRAAGRLEAAVTAVDWRGESDLRFDDLPPHRAAVAVLMVDGVELARSEPLRLGNDPAAALIEVPVNGQLDVLPAHSNSDWCVWVRHADGSEILGREIAWLDAGVPFRCALPAGEYLLWLGYEGDPQYRKVPCTLLAAEARVLRVP